MFFGHSLAGLLVVGALAAPAWSAASTSADDPLLGTWHAVIGNEQERIDAWLEFRSKANGELTVLVTHPMLSYYGADLQVPIERAGNHVKSKELGLDLTLHDGRLEGILLGPGNNVTLDRSAAAPAAPTIPAVPAGPRSDFRPTWETRLNGQIFATPAIATDEAGAAIAYIGTTGGVFNAVRVSDGQFVWTFPAGRPIYGEALVTAVSTEQPGAVYFVCDNGYLFKLDQKDGKELWRYDLDDHRVPRIVAHPVVFEWDWQAPKPVLAEDTVFVGGGDGGFHAVDVETGKRKWRFEAGKRIRNGAAINGDHVVFGSGGVLFALERSSGREVWRANVGPEIDATPVPNGESILIGNRGGGLYAIDAKTGETKWRKTFWGSWVESTPIIHEGIAYIGASDLRRVSAIDPTSGKVLWRNDVFGWTWGTPAIAGDVLYAGVAGGRPYFIPHVASITALDRKTGRMLWRYPLPEVPGAHQWGIAGNVVLADGLLIAATIEGGLYAFTLAEKKG